MRQINAKCCVSCPRSPSLTTSATYVRGALGIAWRSGRIAERLDLVLEPEEAPAPQVASSGRRRRRAPDVAMDPVEETPMAEAVMAANAVNAIALSSII